MRQMPCSERQKRRATLRRLYRRQAGVYGYNTGNKKHAGIEQAMLKSRKYHTQNIHILGIFIIFANQNHT